MILVDRSVWIDHLRSGEPDLKRHLDEGQVVTHPYVIAELALGTLKDRAMVLQLLGDLPGLEERPSSEVMSFIDENAIFGRGIGYVDASLLAAAHRFQARLRTSDKRLRSLATQLALSAD